MNELKTLYLRPGERITSENLPEMVLALGYFDGIHRGHLAVIRTAKRIAAKQDIAVGVMTFHPPPVAVLSEDIAIDSLRYISPLSVKEEQLEEEDVDYLFIVHFDKAFASLTPEEFINQYVLGVNTIHAVAGFDFKYGFRGRGTMEQIPEYSSGRVQQTTVAEVTEHKKKISSTRIRDNILAGNMNDVHSLLGRPYTIKGKVVEGEKRGRTIGFPTANVQITEPFIVPAVGVYAVRMKVKGKWHNGVCNVGYKPTFHEKSTGDPVIEVHLFERDDNIYGENVVVEWYEYIRGEKKFNSVHELTDQIEQDKRTAKSLLEITRKT